MPGALQDTTRNMYTVKRHINTTVSASQNDNTFSITAGCADK